ncbi:MAG: GNAT family N-acetyltransferase [Elusimicrobiota bacterium]|nr:GNAT family N-acetyltransferase [Elusimicrobiota bacterium]
MALTCKPVTPARWKDLETLFEGNGVCRGCWCMWNRLPSADYKAGYGAGNKKAMKNLVKAGKTPGVLAYDGKTPVGWAAVGPRSEYRRLDASRILKPVDARETWATPCFYTAKEARGKGVTVTLLKAAAAHAKRKGARLIEGYPVDTRGKKAPAAFVWWGLAPAFKKTGFKEVLRRSKTRPIMRKAL